MSELDGVLALGVAPVGVTEPLPHYLAGRARGVTLLGSVDDPDTATIDLVEPDVILGLTPSHKRLYERLREIAPTVIADERVDWKSNLRHDGEALGRVDRAEALLTAYDGRAGRLRRRLRGGRLAGLPTQARRSLRRPFVRSILADAGLRPPRRGSNRVPGARPGPFDHWTLGAGYLAANRVLRDLERYLGR